MSVRIQLVRGSSILPKLATRVSNLPMADLAQAWRAVISEEFANQVWYRKGGSRKPWQRTRPFGTRAAPSRTLHDTGALRNAWTGRGAGSIRRISKDRVVLGVSASLFPQASLLRGGSGENIRTTPTRIRVTPRMRAAVRYKYNVNFKRNTKTISVTPRPHATSNPEVRSRFRAILSAHISGRQYSKSLTSIV